jgi:hypothetical protein
MIKKVKAKKKKKPIRYVPINENKEYEQIVLILKRNTVKEIIKTISTPLS